MQATALSLVYHVSVGLGLYAFGSFIFDIVHYYLHIQMRRQRTETNNNDDDSLKSSSSPFSALQTLIYAHAVHHYFFNRRLHFNKRYEWLNLALELSLEVALQLMGVWIAAGLVKLAHLNHILLGIHIHPNVLWIMHVFMLARLAVVWQMQGRDSNHIGFKRVPVCRNWLLVGPEYHALHHVFPDMFHASFVKIFDWMAGTAYALRGRRVTITGTRGAYGSAMCALLEKEGAKVQRLVFGQDWNYSDYSKCIPILKETDVLILAHGSKLKDADEANCHSMVILIELYRHLRQEALLPPEVWAVGSEIEFHPAWGNAELGIYLKSKRLFMEHALYYYQHPDVLYRHIVPAAFTSQMGPGLISASTAVQWTMWFIRAGFHYIPVTYSTLAFWHYFKFTLFVTAHPPTKQHSLKVQEALNGAK